MLDRRMDVLLEEYRRAGCRTAACCSGTRSMAPRISSGSPATTRRLQRLFELAPGVEPSRKLTVLIRGVGGFRVLRFGITPQADAQTVHSAESGRPLVLDVFDGEILQFSVQNFASTKPGDPTKSYANAVAASLEGQALAWSGNAARSPDRFAPKLVLLQKVSYVSNPDDPRSRSSVPSASPRRRLVYEDGRYHVARPEFADASKPNS